MDTEQNTEVLTAPNVDFSPDKIDYFEDILQTAFGSGNTEPIRIVQPYSTVEFLRYLVECKQCLLHGSNHSEIIEFEPRRQTDYKGRMITAVFAAADGIAPIFYAILDRANYRGSLRNMFKRETDSTGAASTHYRFSIDADSLSRYPWVEGIVYVFPRDSFVPVMDEGGEPLLEWVSQHPVRPIACIPVTPDDFPFLRNVQGHDDQLQILLSRFLTSYEALQALSDGYAFSYRWSNAWSVDAKTLTELLRADMPSIRIALNCEPNDGPVWLHLRGSTEVKELLQHALECLHG